jgi:hypothetical protein
LDLAFTAFAARMALLMFGGDESGTESLTRQFVRTNTGAAGPELDQRVAELMNLAREMVAAFTQVQPEVTEATLRAHERDVFEGITERLDGDGV